MNKRIAIQGFEGSFHEEATERYFGAEVELICCKTFKQVIKNAQTKSVCDAGVMAIENSIAGSILPNYTLLAKSNLKIIGEVYLPIKQQLMVNHGVKLEDIKEVHSHPMALLQCGDYLDKMKWRLVETEDTALSARHLKTFHSKHIAAIASKLAAKKFDLNIIASNIQTEKNNYTRFLVLQPSSVAVETSDTNKASIMFNTNHTKGSLAKVLSTIANADVNLSKLQSMPIAGSNFLYCFYADLEFTNKNDLEKALKNIKPLVENVTVFGVYKNGKI